MQLKFVLMVCIAKIEKKSNTRAIGHEYFYAGRAEAVRGVAHGLNLRDSN